MTGQGLTLDQAAILLSAPDHWNDRIFECASDVNLRAQNRVVRFYGVVYIHDYCVNHCSYCGDSAHAIGAKRKLLTKDEFIADVNALLSRHPLREICFLMGEDWRTFSHDQLTSYMKTVSNIYDGKIILNVPPLTIDQFRRIREALPHNKLQFRVFQETYDADIYRREHLHGPKTNIEWRINSQARALEAGFDEVGHGVLYGINDKPWGHQFDTLAMIAHSKYLKDHYDKRSASMSFPRVLPAPDIAYHPASSIKDDTLIRCISVAKLADPLISTIITCRETDALRRSIRKIVNIEDFSARPGPGGNSISDVRQQMFLPDMREGEAIREEMIRDGYKVQ
jgi:2-iminoacetate synthase